MRFLVLSASMGAGHDQAADEMARRLRACGDDVRVVDLLAILPAGLGGGLRHAYRGMLARAPWLYQAIYRAFFAQTAVTRGRGVRPGIAPMTALAARCVAGAVDELRPDAVVSTFHLCAQATGRLRSQGRLRVPAIVFVTDFAPHRLWLHPGNDAFVCIHPGAAQAATMATKRLAIAPGPVVDPAFTTPAAAADRERTRADLGIAAGQVAVLVSGGSWGTGETESVATTVAATGRYVPIALCGHNSAQRDQISATLAELVEAGIAVGGVALGWRDDVAALMRACDALVDNAAGLTAIEALASGLPVLTYRPIPGHGRDGVAHMAGAGLAYRTGSSLVAALDAVTTDATLRSRLVATGKSIFAEDAARVIRDLAYSRPPEFPAMIGRERHDLSAAGADNGADAIGGQRP